MFLKLKHVISIRLLVVTNQFLCEEDHSKYKTQKPWRVFIFKVVPQVFMVLV
jgi:hypothetical protein